MKFYTDKNRDAFDKLKMSEDWLSHFVIFLVLFELFFDKKKNLLVGASSMLWVVDKSGSQSVSER